MVCLTDYDVVAEVKPNEWAAFFRFTFPEFDQKQIFYLGGWT